MTTIPAFIIPFQLLHDSSCSCHHRQIHVSRSLFISIHPFCISIHSIIQSPNHVISSISSVCYFISWGISHFYINPSDWTIFIAFSREIPSKNSTSPHMMASSFKFTCQSRHHIVCMISYTSISASTTDHTLHSSPRPITRSLVSFPNPP